MCAKAVSSKFISNFQVHFKVSTSYSVVPQGGAAFNATQFCRPELLNKHSRYIMKKGFRLSIARHFQSCDFVYLLLSIHVVFYCSLRLASRCLASTLLHAYASFMLLVGTRTDSFGIIGMHYVKAYNAGVIGELSSAMLS